MFVTYFNAGLRVYDLADPATPREVGSYIPPCPPGQPVVQINDVWVGEDHLVYLTDRINGGIYILQPDDGLDVRMKKAALR